MTNSSERVIVVPRPEGCCALGTCTDPTCYLCRTVGQLPQPVFRMTDALREDEDPVRDGVAVKQGRDPVWTKRSRKALT